MTIARKTGGSGVKNHGNGISGGEPHEVAAYVEDLARELEALSRSKRLERLADLLSLTVQEARGRALSRSLE